MLLKIQIKSQGQGKMNALLGEVQCRSQRFQKRARKAVIRKCGHSGLVCLRVRGAGLVGCGGGGGGGSGAGNGHRGPRSSGLT